MKNIRLVVAACLVLLGVSALFGFFHWTINRIYVSEGESLMLRYKGPLLFGSRKTADPGHFAKEGEIGVLESMRGPGRHFYCPIWWERTLVKDFVVEPGKVAIVTHKLGEPLPEGQFLVDGDLDGDKRATHKGVLRKAYGPGRYRANPYAFEFTAIGANQEKVGDQVKNSGWVEIPTGYVGVVTYLTDNPLIKKKSGIQNEVLPPGLYPVNPREQQVDIIEVGFRETSITVDKQTARDKTIVHDESGEPLAVPHSGINFPSNDGFNIQLDFTAIWGVMPEQAPDAVRTFGSVEAVEQKVILPQCESICRTHGSERGAVELLVGESRQKFQSQTSLDFEQVLKTKNLTLLYGLVRHIYIPQEVRIPIQNGYIADEMKLTRDQEKETAKSEADLREAEKKVDFETEKVKVETTKLSAKVIADGQKTAREIDAETKQLVAEIDRKIADLDAERRVLLGEAEAKAQKLQAEAEAQKFQLAVEAFGGAVAYNKWQFAQGLPENLDLRLIYSGAGTLWTDLKNIVPTLPVTAPPATKKPAER